MLKTAELFKVLNICTMLLQPAQRRRLHLDLRPLDFSQTVSGLRGRETARLTPAAPEMSGDLDAAEQ